MTVVAVVFAITNRAPVTLDLWPLGISVGVPLFAVILGSAFVGLLVGAAAAWLSGGAARRRARKAQRRAAELERELARMRRERQNARPGPATTQTGQAGQPTSAKVAAERAKLPATGA